MVHRADQRYPMSQGRGARGPLSQCRIARKLGRSGIVGFEELALTGAQARHSTPRQPDKSCIGATRVTIIHEIVSPYRAPLFAALADEPDLEITVVLCGIGEVRRSWAINLEQLPYPWTMARSYSFVLGKDERGTWFIPVGLYGVLERLRPDVIILNGYAALPTLAALVWARHHRIPTVLWSESFRRGRGGAVRALKRAVVRRADAYLVPGRLAGRHLELLGAEPTRIFDAPNCIDLKLFQRAALPPGDEFSLIACGQLIKRKGWSLIASALADIHQQRRVHLVLVGEGPDRDALESELRLLGIRATFTGHLQYEDLPKIFASGHAVVFPTFSDVWGFALQEGMACGLPAVASNQAGATVELVVEGVSGWIVEPTVESLASALRKLLSLQRDEWLAMSAAARSSAEKLSVRAAVDGFRAAVAAAGGA